VLTLADIRRILDEIMSVFSVSTDAEITLEANPDDLGDDLSPAYLFGLRDLGINRLSIGVQSFHDHELKAMNRLHDAREAVRSVEEVLRCGFENVTLDLIYGLPNSTLESWSHSLETALALSPPHLSCYHLTFEEKTAFANFRKKGKLHEVSDAISWAQYQRLCDRMGEAGYEHYEISNFARKGWQSRHNHAYWIGIPYLGIGPAAHSFDGESRQWNIANNRKYREAISRGTVFYEKEILSDKDRFHDYLLTRLRTAKGIDLRYLKNNFPTFYPDFYREFARYLDTDLLEGKGNRYRLTEKGMFQSDVIIGDLFVDSG
ncbi:MAG: radical SAM family heme chaperone HemW, partial [Gammaproteobacteria bacterium]|nr:radical SAM family heme chaperone HemW [Gammaproteobacteria bacterium]